MALSTHSFLLIPILLLALTPFKATSSSHHHHNDHLKSLHFSLYQQETVNKTGYIIVEGVEGGPRVTKTTSPFGTLFAFQDSLTLNANRSSKLVGISEGTTVTSSLDGLRNMAIGKLTLRLKNHKGSISFVGVINNVKHSNVPLVGGTENFLFVQGCVTFSSVDIKDLMVVYKIEFHLY